ncbi:DUF4190 domain-containing protein [Aporhodopirellula aestuarii]|uniref:DUF4190 domain-containing protein n=1 Tax=Aporhodopirellula aestuarii TaxID=2950107 RepID=A0ABT0U961_9BACT|nr:DUF4190 domain-containing protein [Aporhodopirellula aestuarii]MCM2373445.1 DUF4190 domain-containing protein [Aporhodopirellula aestuarii]
MTDSEEKASLPANFLTTPKSTDQAKPSDGFAIPKMGAEVGYEVLSDDDVPPFRSSGLVCLILGLLSFSALVAWQMLVLPIAAIIFGLVAMRKWTGQRPAGTTAAVIGLILATGFGAAGITIPLAKNRTMGNQAVYFAKEYLELVGRGDAELALELRKEARNRQLTEMNLKQAYSKDPIAKESMEAEGDNGLIDIIQAAGPDIPWELAEPPRVFVKYNMERVDTYWVDPSGRVKEKIQLLMQWSPNEQTKKGEWHVNLFQIARELIVAPSIL